MATFITAIHFTGEGIKEIGDTTKRATQIKSSGKKMGVKVTDIYWTLGNPDGYLIYDAPDDETAAGFLVFLGSQGKVKTSTVRAFTASEMEKILDKSRG